MVQSFLFSNIITPSIVPSSDSVITDSIEKIHY